MSFRTSGSAIGSSNSHDQFNPSPFVILIRTRIAPQRSPPRAPQMCSDSVPVPVRKSNPAAPRRSYSASWVWKSSSSYDCHMLRVMMSPSVSELLSYSGASRERSPYTRGRCRCTFLNSLTRLAQSASRSLPSPMATNYQAHGVALLVISKMLDRRSTHS